MILYYFTGHECTSYAPCVAPTPRHTHTHTVLFRAIPSIKLCAHFFFIIFIWNEYECQFSCCLLLLLLLFCCWFFPFKNFCFLVINYISAVAAASAAATRPALRLTGPCLLFVLIQDHLSSICGFGAHASIADLWGHILLLARSV